MAAFNIPKYGQGGGLGGGIGGGIGSYGAMGGGAGGGLGGMGVRNGSTNNLGSAGSFLNQGEEGEFGGRYK